MGEGYGNLQAEQRVHGIASERRKSQE